MRITILSLLIIGIACGCSKMKHQTTTVKFEVEDVTGVNQMKPFQVALIEESIPLDLSLGPTKRTVELFEPEVGKTITFETELSKRDKYGYYIQFIPLDGYYDSGLNDDGFSYTNKYICQVDKVTESSCTLKLEPCFNLSLRSINEESLPGDSIILELNEANITFKHQFSGKGNSPMSISKMPYGYQTLSYQVYEDGALILDHEESFFAPHNLDTLIEVSF